MMAHDFVRWPELTNSQISFYYFESPHKQITEDFDAVVVKVLDGDTLTLRWPERNFDFPLRFSNIAAPELKAAGGLESTAWLKSKLEGKLVHIGINPKNRVEKWGRLLGTVYFNGLDVGIESILAGKSLSWAQRNEGKIEVVI